MNELSQFLGKVGASIESAPEEEQEPQCAPDALQQFLAQIGGCGQLEILKFYNGEEEIRYDATNHKYYKVGELGNLILLDGTTSTVHIIDRSFALVPWGAKKVIEKILTLVPTYIRADGSLMVREMTMEDFTKIALEAKGAPKDELEEAGDLGHMAHKWLEKYILALIAKNTETQRRLLTEMCQDDRASHCCHDALDWMKAHNVRFLTTERKVYSRKHGYAGTEDGRALVDSCDDVTCCPHAFKDRLSIIDWKSSNYLYIEYLFQTAAYEAAEMEELGIQIEDRWVLRLGKEDGKFESWHLEAEDFEDDFAGFLACLQLSRLAAAVDERMGTQKRIKREAKKEAKQLAKQLAEAAEKALKAIAKAQKKLQKEVEKAAIKEAAAKAKAEKKAAKIKKGLVKAENESQILVQRTAELSPRVAALLEEAHNEPIRSIKKQLSKPSEGMSAVPNEPTRNTELRTASEVKVQHDIPTMPNSTKVSETNNSPVLVKETLVEFKPFSLPEEKL